MFRSESDQEAQKRKKEEEKQKKEAERKRKEVEAKNKKLKEEQKKKEEADRKKREQEAKKREQEAKKREQEAQKKKKEAEKKKQAEEKKRQAEAAARKKKGLPDENPLRELPVRLCGYANAIAVNTNPLFQCRSYALRSAYWISLGYILFDVLHQTGSRNNTDKQNIESTAITATDVLIWQSCASLLIPRHALYRVRSISAHFMRGLGCCSCYRFSPYIALATIPLIYYPIDRFMDYVMDNTYRKWVTRPLTSA